MSMKLHIFFKLFLVFFISNNLFAQESIDLLTISGRYGFPQSYKTDFPGKATEYGSLVNLKFPIRFSESTIWYNDLTYNFSYVRSDYKLPDSLADPINLSGFIFQTGLVQRIDETKAFQILFVPRFMTDFENADGNSLQLGAIVLYEKRFHDRLMMRFGAMYNDEFGGPFLVPLVYVDWIISERWNVSGLFPIYGKLNYKVNENFTAGISHFGLITSYRLGNPNYAGDYMERTSIDLTLFGRHRIAGNIHLEGRFGYALGREYAQYAEDQKADFRISIISFGDDRVQKNVSFNSGLIADLRLVYNLPLTEEK